MVLYFSCISFFALGAKNDIQGKIQGQRESYTFETLPNHESQKSTLSC